MHCFSRGVYFLQPAKTCAGKETFADIKAAQSFIGNSRVSRHAQSRGEALSALPAGV
jgi:hypothetical protein